MLTEAPPLRLTALPACPPPTIAAPPGVAGVGVGGFVCGGGAPPGAGGVARPPAPAVPPPAGRRAFPPCPAAAGVVHRAAADAVEGVAGDRRDRRELQRAGVDGR